MKRWVILVMGIGLVFSAGAVAPPLAQEGPDGSSFTPLGSLYTGAEFHSQPWDVSADGTAVVGNTGGLAFHWTEATQMVELPSILGPGRGSGGDGVSSDGSKAAGTTSGQGGGEACRWSWVVDEYGQGTWVAEGLGDLEGGSYDSVGYAMSANGDIVVGFGNSNRGQEACRWTWIPDPVNGGGIWNLEGLGDLPGGNFGSEAYGCSADGSVVVGDSAIRNGWRAFRWTKETGMKDLGVVGNRKWGVAFGCSGNGLVVVGESFANRGRDEVAFRWTQETGMVGLGDLPGGKALSEAEATNYDGSIVVGWSQTARGMEAFIWDSQNKMRSLENVLATKNIFIPTGWRLRAAGGVTSNAGVVTIVGTAVYTVDSIQYTQGFRAVIADYQ